MTGKRTERLGGWGRYPRVDCPVSQPATQREARTVVQTEPALIARGNGRSYGDSSLSADLTLDMRKVDRIRAFDPASGRLDCEAGILLGEIIDLFLPHGWFPSVTPGTKLITVGGAIAADVHGKNHHSAGSFCDHVDSLELAIGDGRVLTCSRDQNADLFAATCGGMGLTGVILSARIGLRPVKSAWIRQTTHHASTLRRAMDLLADSAHATYSVAWIDCLASGRDLGRSVVFLGEHAAKHDLEGLPMRQPLVAPVRPKKSVPLDFPEIALNTLSVRAFNTVYYNAQRDGEALVDYDTYFYPLDAINAWNRIYGRRGLVQYQFVLPPETSEAGLEAVLTNIAKAGGASFLAVLKLMGPSSFGHLSFPRPGYTLALDFQATDANLALLERLDHIVIDHGGRFYLAKDARMSPGTMAAGYPDLNEFRAVRERYGLTDRFRSSQSLRLEI